MAASAAYWLTLVGFEVSWLCRFAIAAETFFGAIVFSVGYWFYYQEFKAGLSPSQAYYAERAAAAEKNGIDPTEDELNALTQGTALALGWIPQSWAIGDGKYALLLGTNLYGLALCTLGFVLPLALQRRATSVPAAVR